MASPPTRLWPDAADSFGLIVFAAFAIGLPAIGYVLMYLDFRRWLRSLRRALMVVAQLGPRATPRWAVWDRPPCLAALELALPCSEAEVMAAYRRRAKELHPDHGGDLAQFLRLQKYVDEALELVRQHPPH